jgi:hypothetical protein
VSFVVSPVSESRPGAPWLEFESGLTTGELRGFPGLRIETGGTLA